MNETKQPEVSVQLSRAGTDLQQVQIARHCMETSKIFKNDDTDFVCFDTVYRRRRKCLKSVSKGVKLFKK